MHKVKQHKGVALAVFLLLPLDHTLRCSMLISAAAPVAMAASLATHAGAAGDRRY